MNEKYNAIIALVGGILGYLFGGVDMLLKVFVTILILDTVSGMFKGYVTGSYTSKKFRNGLWKKCGYMLAIILTVQLDKITGDIGALRDALLFCFIANEGTSIVENLGEIGVPFPQQVMNAIAVLKKPAESEQEIKTEIKTIPEEHDTDIK